MKCLAAVAVVFALSVCSSAIGDLQLPVAQWAESGLPNAPSGTTSTPPAGAIVALKRDAGLMAGGATDARFNGATVRTVTVSDAFLYNYGDGSWSNAGGVGSTPGTSNQLYKFDLSSIPAGSTINLAQLRIYHTGGNAGGCGVGMILTHDWTQGTGIGWGSYPGAAGGVSFAHPNGHNTAANQNSNGGTSTPLQSWGPNSDSFFSMSSDVGSVQTPSGEPVGTGYHVINVTAHVQAWVNGTSPNYGWAQNIGNWVWILSEAGSAQQPVLFVDYGSAAADTTAPAAVSNLAAGNATNATLMLTWTAPGDDGSTGTAASYDIRYRTGGAVNDSNWASATQVTGEPTPAVAGTNQSLAVNGLAASTTYYFAIKTSDEVPNISLISNSPSGTTNAPDSTAPAAVSNLATSNPTTSSITLTWTAPGDDGSTGTAASYDIRYSTSTIDSGNWASATQVSGEPTPAVAGTNQNKVVSGLSAGTTYYFAMKASDEVPNVSALSNVPSDTTSAPDVTAPAAVIDLAAGNPTTNTMTLTWTAPGDDGSTGIAASYDVRYRTDGAVNDSNWASATQVSGEPAPAAAGSSQTMTVRGLPAGITYYFAIRTSDEVPNISAISNSPSSTTLPGTPNNKPILSPRDFNYRGYYIVQKNSSLQNLFYSQGFTHRYVSGQLRFLTMTWQETSQPFNHQLIEFAPPASLGGTVTTRTNLWSDIYAGTGLGTGNGIWSGLWYEQAQERLWTTWTVVYPNAEQQAYTKSLAIRTLNSNGTISNVAGPWGLQGIQQRQIFGGVQAVPAWFQASYNVGPYTAGWGGQASLNTGLSLGPTFYTFPEPTGYPAGDIPASDFRQLMYHCYDGPDWYASGYPTTRDRGVRNVDIKNDYDTPHWQAPAPDGLGRWVMGDSNWSTGNWIETPNKQGFVLVPKFFSGRAWYELSAPHCQRQTAEIQVFDPNMLGEVAQGTRANWNTYPTYRWQITDVVKSLGFAMGAKDGSEPAGGPIAATYDSTTQTLYVYCTAGPNNNSYILIYDVDVDPAVVEDVAVNETAVTGTVGTTTAGGPANRGNTETKDGVYETITEVVQGSTSQLEHKWTFNVTAGSGIEFDIKAYKTSNTESDSFVFAYSTNGTNWTNMVTVSRTSDDGTFQTCSLFGGLQGTVYVRVQDSDRTAGNNNLDTIYIDKMYFRSLPGTYLPGDVNGDSHVDVVDLLYLVDAFGSVTGDVNYSAACDFNSDDSVDVVDLLTLVENFGL